MALQDACICVFVMFFDKVNKENLRRSKELVGYSNRLAFIFLGKEISIEVEQPSEMKGYFGAQINMQKVSQGYFNLMSC